jgi:hypothetical protein
MVLPDPPPGWGNDDLTKFLDDVRGNMFATFFNLKTEYGRLSAIDVAFRTASANLDESPDWFAAFFLWQAHSSFLGAVQLILSGQVSETYACLRQTLENTLYGFYISKKPASREIWLRRHDSDDARQKVKTEFIIRNLLDTLTASDSQEGKIAKTLYDETIDYGAHPNERGLMQKFEMRREEEKTQFNVKSVVKGDAPASLLALQRSAQVGVFSLGIFGFIYPEQFALRRLTDTIQRLKSGL